MNFLRGFFIIVITCLLISLFPHFLYSYERIDHARMHQYIAEKKIEDFSLGEYLGQYLGFKDTYNEIIVYLWWINYMGYGIPIENPEAVSVLDCLKNGGMNEDIPITRCSGHFHNPLEDWVDAGFKDSAPALAIWMQNQLPEDMGGDYDWDSVRETFYKAMTTEDPDDRAGLLRDTFQGVGHLMHLVQDASAPMHVRDDFHWLNSYDKYIEKIGDGLGSSALFEKYYGWFSNDQYYVYDDSLLDLPPNPAAPNPIARLIDSDKYNRPSPDQNITVGHPIGLAEYTNANFFSEDTIFDTNAFPYPNWDNVDNPNNPENRSFPDPDDNSKIISRQYLRKSVGGDTGYLLCTAPVMYAYDNMPRSSAYQAPILDDIVYDEYAQRLVPRAISYSTGLLKYFFRGTMEVSYRISQSVDGFRVTAFARNSSNNDTGSEDIEQGTVQLVIKYKSAADTDYRYLVTAPQEVSRIDTDSFTRFDFDLQNYVPLLYEDSMVFLVFRGVLGAEDKAVCIGNAQHLDILEVSLPDKGVYAFLGSTPDNPSTRGFDQITLQVKNSAPDTQRLTGGTIDLIVEYRLMSSNPFTNYFFYPGSSEEIHSLVVPYDGGREMSLPAGETYTLEFDLDKEIPLWATDVCFYVVYQGTMETSDFATHHNSVCIGFKDVSEPTPIDFFNNTDYECMYGDWYDMTDPGQAAEATNLLSPCNDRPCKWLKDYIKPKNLNNLYVRFSSINNPRGASPVPGNYLFSIDQLEPGTARRVFMISESTYCYSVHCSDWGGVSTFSTVGIQNDMKYYPDRGMIIRYHPAFSVTRQIEMWCNLNFGHYDIKDYEGYPAITSDDACKVEDIGEALTQFQ